MDTVALVIFGLVYLGMILGELPGLALDRTGVALLGAIAMVTLRRAPASAAWDAVDVPTITLLFGMMVISAQFRLAGAYTRIAQRLVSLELSPRATLAVVIGVAGAMSAVLTNDVVCLAMTPVLVDGCARRKLNPVPFLLALACASNVGSAATLIGNPQNILIGQQLHLSFAGYLMNAAPPAILGLGAVWLVVWWRYRARLVAPEEATTTPAPAVVTPAPKLPALDRWQAGKGVVVTVALITCFLFVHDIPREVVALACAGVLLLSRRMASREIMSLVDWQLLVLFIGLFIVNDAFQRTGAMTVVVDTLRESHLDLAQPAVLFGASVVLSNIVSNVPATMLLLPSATHSLAGPILALSSTLAGNLFIVGSIANIIVVTTAKPLGVNIDFRTHLRVGLPVTLLTLLIAAAWLRSWCARERSSERG